MASCHTHAACCQSSHRIHRIHRSFWRRIFSHGFHRCSQIFRLRYWRCGYGRMPYPPNLCASVSICGRLSLPEGSVCSAYSVGHSLCLLCWCCRGSCTSVVVFSHGFHVFPQMIRLRCWRRGYGRMPYPPNLCASVYICGRHFSARMFCVFCVFCGTLSLFALLVLQRQLHQRGSILPRNSRISTDG